MVEEVPLSSNNAGRNELVTMGLSPSQAPEARRILCDYLYRFRYSTATVRDALTTLY
jgi:hypothetical protein